MTETLFYNVWRTHSPGDKARLIEMMQADGAALAAKPGFRSLVVVEGDDDRVLVEGRWESREAFDAAVTNDPDAQAGRERLAAFGSPEPGIFTEAFRLDPVSAGADDYPSTDFWRQFQRSTVEANGLALNVVTGGEGEPVLLIHGFPETWNVWHRIMPALASRYRVIAPDLRGFGDSAGGGTGYDKRTLAADMGALLDALGVGRVHVVGHDFGGQVAYALATARRDQVATLTVIEALLPQVEVASRGDEGRFWIFPFHSAPHVPEMLTRGREREYVHALWDIFVEPDSEVTPEDRAEVERTWARPGSLASGFELYRSTPQDVADLTPEYARKLAMPVLALGGEHCFENRVLETFRQVASDVTGGIVPGAAHFTPLERSAATAEPILAFLGANPIADRADA